MLRHLLFETRKFVNDSFQDFKCGSLVMSVSSAFINSTIKILLDTKVHIRYVL